MKKFELTVTEENWQLNTIGNNDGFNALELIGLLELKKQDIINQINHPELFKHTRTAIVDGEQISIEEADDQ